MHLTAGSGALVNNVATEGPAFHSNIRPGDVIASASGHPIHGGHDLIRETIAQEVGQPLQLEIIRGGQRYGASVTLSERPEAAVEPAPVQQQAPRQGMGLVVRDLSPEQAAQMNLGSKRVPVLTQVTPGSAADRAGLRAGDVIVEANGVQEPGSTQVAELARSGALVLRVKRGDMFFYAALKR
jgi:serine protease Do